MFKPIKAKTVAEYMRALPPERRETITFLDRFIKKTAPKLQPHLAYNMLGYGTFPYRNYKGEMIMWPIVALASQKNYFSLYVCALQEKKYLAEINKEKLGKVSVGKSCIRFKKIDDINLVTLKKVLRQAAKKPGLVSS